MSVIECQSNLKADLGQVAVSQSVTVGELRKVLVSAAGRGTSARISQLAQDGVDAPALNVLHDVVMVPILVSAAKYRHDIGMMQSGRRPGFPLEPLDLFRMGKQARGQNLQRDATAQPCFLGLVHHAHAAAADLADDPKALDRGER